MSPREPDRYGRSKREPCSRALRCGLSAWMRTALNISVDFNAGPVHVRLHTTLFHYDPKTHGSVGPFEGCQVSKIHRSLLSCGRPSRVDGTSLADRQVVEHDVAGPRNLASNWGVQRLFGSDEPVHFLDDPASPSPWGLHQKLVWMLQAIGTVRHSRLLCPRIRRRIGNRPAAPRRVCPVLRSVEQGVFFVETSTSPWTGIAGCSTAELTGRACGRSCPETSIWAFTSRTRRRRSASAVQWSTAPSGP